MTFAEQLRSAWGRNATGIIIRRIEMELGEKVSPTSFYDWRERKHLPHDPRVLPILARILRLDLRELQQAYREELKKKQTRGKFHLQFMERLE